MKTRQLLGLIGSIVLFVGVFAPIVSLPIVGTLNFFRNGQGDGVIILILAAISVVLVLTQNYKGLWITGVGSIAVCLFTLVEFQSRISQIKTDMESELTGNPFRGLADIAINSVQLEWGWALLIGGAVLVIAAAATKE